QDPPAVEASQSPIMPRGASALPTRLVALDERDEARAFLFAHDEPGPRKVSGQDEDPGVGIALDEFATSHRRALGVGAEAARPRGPGALHRAVHEVAGEHRLSRGRGQPDRDVTRRMTGGRLEAQPRTERVVTVDQHRLTGLDNRYHAIGDAQILLVPPVLP